MAEVERVAGTSRYGTAAAVADEVVARRAAGGALGAGGPALPGLPGDEETAGPDVILASGEVFPDALVAGPLAAVSGRVILLTRSGDLPEETAAAIARLAPVRILIAGGVEAVGEAVEAALADDYVVERLGGDQRFATAAQLVERTIREGGHTDRAFLVDAGDFPDALAAGAAVAALGGMLLPLAAGGLAASAEIAELLDRRADGLVQVTVVGGPAAVSAAVADAVEQRMLVVRSRLGALPV